MSGGATCRGADMVIPECRRSPECRGSEPMPLEFCGGQRNSFRPLMFSAAADATPAAKGLRADEKLVGPTATQPAASRMKDDPAAAALRVQRRSPAGW
jgi:hypothetical protein